MFIHERTRSLEARDVRSILWSDARESHTVCTSIEVEREPLGEDTRRHSKSARDACCMARLREVQGVEILHVDVCGETLKASNHLVLLSLRIRLT